MVKLNFNSAVLVGAGTLITTPAYADINIVDVQAQKSPTIIEIIPGKTTAINFKNQEIISYLKLSDKSKTVYSTNAPIESGQAKSVFFTAIEKLTFPGEITTSTPNLFIVSLDPQGRQREYEFVIKQKLIGEKLNNNKINIISLPTTPPKPALNIKTDLGEATADDIRAGLTYKLKNGELGNNSATALLVAEAIAISLNENRPMLSIAKDLQISLALLSELGRTGLIQKAKYQFKQAPTPSSLNQARQLIMEESNNSIITSLGVATLQDIEFGMDVMKQKGLIKDNDALTVTTIIRQIKNYETTLNRAGENPKIRDLLSEVGRLGLAFEARQRILGSLN
ncbi:hypothetical protein NIES4102_41780 (plasmid) [Chondrocystis sp. NIES-4102]|nr:hypothetical protein NIES4102_41780 [Chondrocystis sp. NIES-4102]